MTYRKYRNKPSVVDGIRFDSKKEAKYYSDLKWRKHAGEVLEFELQKRFPIVHNDVKICNYICDFVEYYPDGTRKVVDVKGVRTSGYRLKKKLMKAFWDIEIVEA